MEQTTLETPASLRLMGSLAVRFRLLSEAQLQQALAQLGSAQREARAGQTLIDMGLLSEAQLAFLIGAQEMKVLRIQDMKFGSIVVEKGFATEVQVDASLQHQKEHYIKYKQQLLIGDILVADGIISEAQKQSVIAVQQQLFQLRATATTTQTHAPVAEPISAASGVELIVSRNGMTATLRAAPSIAPAELRTRIDELLQEYGITFGIASAERIDGWINQGAERDERFVLARGTAPVPGHGGEITYYFDTDPLKAGKIAQDGVIDFKDRGAIPQVAEGTLLAELSDPDPGIAGSDVRGQRLAPAAVRGRSLLCGSGVALSADGKRAVATVSGSPSLARSGALFVFPLYKVDGDIGYKTGHVDFDGDIQVTGAVEKGFRVTGGRLSALEIEDAEITVKGDVVIRGGILGGRIKVGGNLMAAYIHNAQVAVDGDVLVKKEVMDCDIKAGGGFYSESAIVLNSHIAAKAGIIAADIGSDVSAPSTLLVGSDALLELRVAEMAESIALQRQRQVELRQQIEQGELENQQINRDIAEVAQIQDRSQVEQRELSKQRDALLAQGQQQLADEVTQQIAADGARARKAEQDLNALFERQDQLVATAAQRQQEIAAIEGAISGASQELEGLQQQMQEQQADVYVKVTGTLYPMTTITTAHAAVKTRQAMSKLVLREQVRRNQAGDEVWKIVTENIKHQ